MGINIHEFKEYHDKYDVVANGINLLMDNGIYINDRSHKGIIASGQVIANSVATGNLPGWLAFKMLKANIDACAKLVATKLYAEGLVS